MCKMGEEISLAQERYLFIYTKICLGLPSNMTLVQCLMSFEEDVNPSPTISPPKFVERDGIDLCEVYE